MDKDILSKFLDLLILEAGRATIDSKKTKEASILEGAHQIVKGKAYHGHSRSS